MRSSVEIKYVIGGFSVTSGSCSPKVVDTKNPNKQTKNNKIRFMLIPPNFVLFDVLNGNQTPFDKRSLLI